MKNTKNTLFISKSLHRFAGFTLVELIVVITILVILGTIAFISLTGFSGSARDGSRASDIANISKGLDIAYIKTGYYSSPDNSFTVAYSGWALWYQGTIGDGVISLIGAGGARMSKKPTDPLITTKEYTYSKLAYGNAYQLKSDWESDSVAYFISQAYASTGNPTLTYIKGNYNGMVVKTQTGNIIYVLAVPSIVTSQTGTLIDVLSLSGKLLVNGQTNSGGIAFLPSLVYSSGSLPKDDTASGITNLTTAIQTVYSGSVIASVSSIQSLLSTTGSANLVSLGSSIITNYLGGNAAIVPDTTTPTLTCTGTVPTGAWLIASTTTPTNSGTIWTYSGSTTTTSWPACTWSCNSGYSQNGSVGCSAQVYVDDVFSAYTYTGNGGSQTINNGINLSGFWGMVWVKARAGTIYHSLQDTVTGVEKTLASNATDAQIALVGGVTSFNNNGFSIGSQTRVNSNTIPFASWTFRKAPKFFDVLSYTGNNTTGRVISHNLGVTPWMVIIKRIDSSVNGDWNVWHRSTSGLNKILSLNSTWPEQTWTPGMMSQSPDSNNIYLTNEWVTNGGWSSYIMYVFAHDPAPDGIIQAGSFTTDASGNFSVTTLGWEPQFLMVKSSTAVQNWITVDTARGYVATDSQTTYLSANSNAADSGPAITYAPTTNGFRGFGTASQTFIYLAIRRPNKPPTSGTQVYNAITRTGNGAVGATVTGVGFAPDLLLTQERSGNNFENLTDRLRGASQNLSTPQTSAEFTNIPVCVSLFNVDGVSLLGGGPVNWNSWTYINHFFRRAPGFFDIVAYTGNSSTNHAVTHTLGVAPELVIVKSRTGIDNWIVRHKDIAYNGIFNSSSSFGLNPAYLISAVSATTFTLGDNSSEVNNAFNYIAYLFASLPNISKVGSYTGNGTTQPINAGFDSTARYILIKRTDVTGDWFVWDSARGIVAGNDPHLSLNSTAAEVTTDDSVDPDATGFAVNQVAATNINVSGGTYIYLAVH